MRIPIHISVFLFLIGFSFPQMAAYSELPDLIPRKVLFGNPAQHATQISPAGTRLAYLAPSQGVMNLWVKTRGRNDDRMVTKDTRSGIFVFTWGYSEDHLLFLQDKDGDENVHLKAVDLTSDRVLDLTPFDGVRAVNLLKDDQYPNAVLIGLNKRDPRLFDMYRIDLKTGKMNLEAENPGNIISWTTDQQFRIRAATSFREEDLSTAILVRDSIDSPWRELLVTPFEKTPFLGQYNGGSLVIGFSEDGKTLYAATCLNSDTTELVALDVKTGKINEVIAKNPKGDLWDNFNRYEVLQAKKTGRLLAAWFNYFKPEPVAIAPEIQKDISLLQKKESGVFQIISRTADDQIWIVRYISDIKSEAYYIYDRKSGNLEFLVETDPNIAKYKLAKREPIVIPASDGMQLVSYLTLPVGIKPEKIPMVLVPHGGPWARDDWGFDREAQWLANRGYAVLQVNFRGSSGFGVAYMNAGTGGWCTGRMQQDLTDAVKWAIDRGLADPERIAIMGGSYGGYATLCGITQTPDLYSCAIDMVGPSDVAATLKTFPPYWGPVRKRWITRIGTPVLEDEAANRKISPLYNVDRIKVPLLIAHGSNDPRVKQEASDRIVQVIREKKLPVTYIVYPDEGHGFSREPNILDFYSRSEEFVNRCLGGRGEPGEKIEGTSAEIR
jgi:dipeptidyl aminopeptidase/acylaminoacyl peptidase